MTFREDDLAKLFADEPQPTADYRQARVVSFNHESFENTVFTRGSILTNLSVLTTGQDVDYMPGDNVLLMKWTPTGGGLSSYWIAGKLITPIPSEDDDDEEG